MRGKSKCKILKEIRQKIADENDIPYVTRECTYQGECSGTCPKCEEELRYLENELKRREALGKSVAVAALCAGMAMTASACTPIDVPESSAPIVARQTTGSIPTSQTETVEEAVEVEIPDEPPVEHAGEPAIEIEPAETEELTGEEVEYPEPLAGEPAIEGLLEPEEPEPLMGKFPMPPEEPEPLMGDVAYFPEEEPQNE